MNPSIHPSSPFTGPIPAAVYRRVSTDHQEASLVVQEACNDEYAIRFSMTPTKDTEFADEDTSGSIPMRERNGGRALMNRLKHGDIKHVITSKQDRLGRDTRDIIDTIRFFWELGITPHFTLEGGALPRTPQNELLMEIKASVSQYERNMIKDRVRTNASHLFNQFGLTGKVPYGYDCEYRFKDGHLHVSPRALRIRTAKVRDPEQDTHGRKAFKEEAPEPEATALTTMHGALMSSRLISNAPEQAIIHRMAALRFRKSPPPMSLKAIADTLNAQGITTKLGKPWQCGSVDGVLNSRHTARLLQRQSESDQPALAA